MPLEKNHTIDEANLPPPKNWRATQVFLAAVSIPFHCKQLEFYQTVQHNADHLRTYTHIGFHFIRFCHGTALNVLHNSQWNCQKLTNKIFTVFKKKKKSRR